jgi:hypothetical protein
VSIFSWPRWAIATGLVVALAVASYWLLANWNRKEQHREPVLSEIDPHNLPNFFNSMNASRQNPSLTFHRCLLFSESIANEHHGILGCRVSLAAGAFEAWQKAVSWDAYEQPMNGVPTSLELFDLGEPYFIVAAAFNRDPIESRGFFAPLIFVNGERTEAVIYEKIVLVQ